MAGKGLLMVAGDAGWLLWPCISPVALQFSHLHSPSCVAAGLSGSNRLWVLSWPAWRPRAATQSTLHFQRSEPNQLEIDHFIELHIDGSVIVVLTLNICHQAAEPKLSLTGPAHCAGTNWLQ